MINWHFLQEINVSIKDILVYQINIFANKLYDLVELLTIKMLLKEKIYKKILYHQAAIVLEYLQHLNL